MTRAEAFDKAWRIGAKKKDFSFVDEIYHADYSSSDVFTDVKVKLRSLPTVTTSACSCAEYESHRRLLGQCGGGILFQTSHSHSDRRPFVLG